MAERDYEEIKEELRDLALGHDWWRPAALVDLRQATLDILQGRSLEELAEMQARANDRRTVPAVCLAAVARGQESLVLADDPATDLPLVARFLTSLPPADWNLLCQEPATRPDPMLPEAAGQDVERQVLWLRTVALMLLDRLGRLGAITPVSPDAVQLPAGIQIPNAERAARLNRLQATLDAAPRSHEWPEWLFLDLVADGPGRLRLFGPLQVPVYPLGYRPVHSSKAVYYARQFLADGPINLSRACDLLIHVARPLRTDEWDDRLDLAQALRASQADLALRRRVLRNVPMGLTAEAVAVVRLEAPQQEAEFLAFQAKKLARIPLETDQDQLRSALWAAAAAEVLSPFRTVLGDEAAADRLAGWLLTNARQTGRVDDQSMSAIIAAGMQFTQRVTAALARRAAGAAAPGADLDVLQRTFDALTEAPAPLEQLLRLEHFDLLLDMATGVALRAPGGLTAVRQWITRRASAHWEAIRHRIAATAAAAAGSAQPDPVWLEPEMLKALAQAGLPGAAKLLLRVADDPTLDASEKLGRLIRILEQSPETLAREVAQAVWAVSHSLGNSLFEYAEAPERPSPPWYDLLFFERACLGDAPMWVERMAHLLENKRPLPTRFVEAITAGPGRLRRAYEAAPRHWLESAMAQLPLAELLPATLGRPGLARQIEQVVPRGKLLQQIPQVRQALADRPFVAVAFECAAATSLDWWPEFIRAAFSARRANGPGRWFDHLYTTAEIPRRGGGTRRLAIPHPWLKAIQRRMLRYGLQTAAVSDAAHGFRHGHSILTNAGAHCGRAVVVKADVRDCFGSTEYTRIRFAVWAAYGELLSPAAVTLLANLCTFEGALPTGAPTSPGILNIVFATFDRTLARVAARNGLTYTRYADDLVISGHSGAKRLLPLAVRLLQGLGYELHPDKTAVMRRGSRQRVTGLVVNGDRPSLPRDLRRRLRAAAHRRSQGQPLHWGEGQMSEASFRGKLALLQMVHPGEAADLRSKAFQEPDEPL